MYSNIGSRIKSQRVKLNKTQAELSDGIISISYLSKIENESVIPPKEIIEPLCDRLNIDPTSDENAQTTQLCINWFQDLFQSRLDEAKKCYLQIEDKIDLIPDNELAILIEIHKLRYFVLLENTTKARDKYMELQKISKGFNEKQKYYWLKFSGYYHFINLSYVEALTCFQQASDYLNYTFYLHLEEENSLYYMIALSASHSRKIYIALTYANKALKFFQRHYHLGKCAQCHIILGISFLRINDPETALENYQFAETIAKKINDDNLLSIIVQNIGNLNSMMKKSNEAINSFLRSYELRLDGPANKILIPVVSLMKEYYKKNDILEAKQWLEEGFNIISKNALDSIFAYDLEVYNQLINGISDTFEDLLIKEILPFLDKKKLYYEKSSYLQILADYYFGNRKYKQAAIYYSSALKARNIF